MTVSWRWILAAIGTALCAGLLAQPPCDADAAPCDARYSACQAPRWCPTTGTLVSPFSGYCPAGPPNYSQPWGDDDDE
jgi:hypothetical protein